MRKRTEPNYFLAPTPCESYPPVTELTEARRIVRCH